MKYLLILSLFSTTAFAAKKNTIVKKVVSNSTCDSIVEQRFVLNEKIMRYESCKKNLKHKLCKDQERLLKTISNDSRSLITLQNKNPKCSY